MSSRKNVGEFGANTGHSELPCPCRTEDTAPGAHSSEGFMTNTRRVTKAVRHPVLSAAVLAVMLAQPLCQSGKKPKIRPVHWF